MKSKNNSDLPLISVILPTYNRSGLLTKSVFSVLGQSYENIELIIVDDGSTDNTYDVVKSFDDKRIRYVRLNQNLGASAARNVGIDEARGEFIAFQDSDDVWMLDKLEKQVNYLLSDATVDMVFCTLVRIDLKERTVRIKPAKKLPDDRQGFIRELLKINFMWTQTWMLRASILNTELRFKPELLRGEDWDLALNIAKKHKIAHLDEMLVIVNVTHGSLLSSQEQKAVTLSVIMNAHNEFIIKYPDIHAQYCRRLSQCEAVDGSSQGMFAWAWKAFLIQPTDIRNALSLLFSLSGRRGYLWLHKRKEFLFRVIGKQ